MSQILFDSISHVRGQQEGFRRSMQMHGRAFRCVPHIPRAKSVAGTVHVPTWVRGLGSDCSIFRFPV